MHPDPEEQPENNELTAQFRPDTPKTRIFTTFVRYTEPYKMNLKKISLLVLLLVIADQALKIWVKTHMHLDESITVFPDWFQLHFIENKGAAFGMRLSLGDTYDWASSCLVSSASPWSASSVGSRLTCTAAGPTPRRGYLSDWP